MKTRLWNLAGYDPLNSSTEPSLVDAIAFSADALNQRDDAHGAILFNDLDNFQDFERYA